MEANLASWTEKAVKATLVVNHEKLLDKKEKNAIDVHGLTVREALAFVEEYVNEWFSQSRRRLKIITGVGNHSQQGISKLYPALVKCRCSFTLICISLGG